MNTFEASVLQVLRGDAVAGAAFLVSERLVATCAHVVKAAGGKTGETLTLRHIDGRTIGAQVIPKYWREESAEDVAILCLEHPIDDVQPLLVGSSLGTKGHTFSTFGFPKPAQELTGRGEITGDAILTGLKLLQLDSRQVTPGFSGAPIFDEVTKRIVGMVMAITPPDEFQRLGTTAFAIPSEILRAICPELQISDICPYRSLDVFNEEDAPFFFGRAQVIQKMIESLRREPRFLAVLGASGSGKSSVVRAGLIPALRQGKVFNSEKWGIVTIRPSSQPFEQLRGTGVLGAWDTLEAAVPAWLTAHPEKTRLVLVIDQFEELLVSTAEEIRRKFIAEIAHILDGAISITVILTLRSDFYSRFQQDASVLAGWLERGLVNIPPTLTSDEIRDMVSEPAKSIGLSFEEGLVDVILAAAAETGIQRGVASSSILPLLEFTLTQLWEKREDGRLTHSAYFAIGAVSGGLSQWADQAYHALEEADRKIARRILIDLVNFGDEAQGIPDTKRIGRYDEIIRDEKYLDVAEKLVRSRLLLSGYDYSLKQDRLEIIHEALLYEWFQLAKWIQEDRAFMRAYRQFVEDAKEWELSDRDPGLLYRSTRLKKISRHLEVQPAEMLSGIEKEFLEESIRQDKVQTKLMDVSGTLDDTNLGLDDTLQQFLVMLNESVGAEQAIIMLFNAEDKRLHYRAGHGYLPDESTEKVRGIKLKVGEGLSGWVMKRHESLLVKDLHEDPRWVKAGDVPLGQRSAIALPLMVSNNALGTLTVFHRRPNYFSSELLGMVRAIASQAAIAISNANLYSLIRDQAERLGSMLRHEQEDTSRSQAILETVADGVLVTGRDKQVTFLNQSAIQILDVDPQRVIGQPVEIFGELLGSVTRSWLEMIQNWSEGSGTYELGNRFSERLKLENGRIVLVDVAPFLLQDEFLGTVSIFRDITNEVEVDRVKSEFLATVSHELRTPVTSIDGYIDVLLRDAADTLSENQMQLLNIIKNNAERLRSLLGNLLDISRIEAGYLTLSAQPVNLIEVAENVIGDITKRSRKDHKPIMLSLDTQKKLPLVYGDVERIRQILANLIENAYHYTPENGKVIVHIHLNDRNEMQVDVEDNGIGIAPVSQGHLFERFYRGAHPLTQETSGVGLGLSLVKQIVEMHKGRIWVQSSGVPGEGSIFSFTLPVYKRS